MKYFIVFLWLIFSVLAHGQEKEGLLAAWEDIQKNSSQVESFEKIGEKQYKIKFSMLPFEGELIVLGSDAEEIAYRGMKKSYTKMGYVEIDLVGAPDNMMIKYSRSYYKWAANNTLYFNSETGRWVNGKDYADDLVQSAENVEQDEFNFSFFKYWDYFLAAILLYFLITVFINSKRAKDSVRIQKKAVQDMQVSIDMQKKAKQDIQKSIALQHEAMDLHKETNEILGNILKELKQQDNKKIETR